MSKSVWKSLSFDHSHMQCPALCPTLGKLMGSKKCPKLKVSSPQECFPLLYSILRKETPSVSRAQGVLICQKFKLILLPVSSNCYIIPISRLSVLAKIQCVHLLKALSK